MRSTRCRGNARHDLRTFAPIERGFGADRIVQVFAPAGQQCAGFAVTLLLIWRWLLTG